MKPIAKNTTAKAIGAPKEVPVNYTLLGNYVALPERANAFNPKPKWDKNKRGGRRGKGNKKQEMLDPQIYPQVMMGSDTEPEMICKQVIHEVITYGVIWIRKKELQCINSSTYWLFFYLWNFGHIPTLRGEVVNMLEVAKGMMIEEGKLPLEEGEKETPAINLRRAVPCLPGVDTSIFEKYTGECRREGGAYSWKLMTMRQRVWSRWWSTQRRKACT